MKLVHEPRLQLKMNFFGLYHENCYLVGGIQIWWVAFFLVEGNEQTFS